MLLVELGLGCLLCVLFFMKKVQGLLYVLGFLLQTYLLRTNCGFAICMLALHMCKENIYPKVLCGIDSAYHKYSPHLIADNAWLCGIGAQPKDIKHSSSGCPMEHHRWWGCFPRNRNPKPSLILFVLLFPAKQHWLMPWGDMPRNIS